MHPPESKHCHRCAHKGCTAHADTLVTVAMVDALTSIDRVVKPGARLCLLHRPRRCRFCAHWIPWFDGSICDYCDRYADETG